MSAVRLVGLPSTTVSVNHDDWRALALGLHKPDFWLKCHPGGDLCDRVTTKAGRQVILARRTRAGQLLVGN